MEFRSLGRSGLRVSHFGFGAMTFAGSPGGWARIGETSGAAAQRQIDICIDAGVNFFDTADGYDAGQSEIILGASLGTRRPEAVLATKAFFPTGKQEVNDRGLSRRHLIAACEASLKRLATDWIDLYQLHQFDAAVPLDETLSALDHLVASGKVRYVGCSNFFAWQVMKGVALADQRGFERFISHQIQYSLMVRDAEDEILPCGIDQGVGTIVWGAMAAGFLSGKYAGDFDSSKARLATDPRLEEYQVRGLEVLAAIKAIAADRGVSQSQVALNWVAHRRGVTTVLVGARNEQQLLDNLAASQWSLSGPEIDRLDKASQELRRRYPDSHQRGLFPDRNPSLYQFHG